VPTDDDLEQARLRIQLRVAHTFADAGLLSDALIHRSWCAEHPGVRSNERLEFLGDAVLGVVVTDHLFNAYPDLEEGELAPTRAAVVSAAALSEVALEIELGQAMLLGKGEEFQGGRTKPSILADALEAIIGAVYLDGGIEAARTVVMGLLAERLALAAAGPGRYDFKTRLQELAARRGPGAVRYEVTDVGPDHAKTFTALLFVGDEEFGEGVGRTKKTAEQAAARMAFESLTTEVEELIDSDDSGA
jgi:ribonuclease-3